jgi:hypothetical protein
MLAFNNGVLTAGVFKSILQSTTAAQQKARRADHNDSHKQQQNGEE